MQVAKLRTKLVPWLFQCGRSILEVTRDSAGQSALTPSPAAAVAGSTVLPLSILGLSVIDQAEKHWANRPEADALQELFRESLLAALTSCVEPLADESQVTQEDRAVLDLWREGLAVSSSRDPLWARMLEEEIPPAAARLISVDLRQPSSCWPLLRALLAQWTDWFRYRRTAGSAPLGVSIPPQPLLLSPYLERYLAANLPASLSEKLRPEITSGAQETAFRHALIGMLAKLDSQVAPLDPLTPITDFPTVHHAKRQLQLLDARFRAIPYVGREGDLEGLWNWLLSGEPVSFQVIAGRGGSGKTRIAYRLLELIEERAPFTWHAGLLEPQRFAASLANERFRRWRGRRPTLIVIDYAASCTEHLKNNVVPELRDYGLAADPNAPPLRFLLLERGADEQQGWYASLRRAAGNRAPDLFPDAPLHLAGLDAGQLFQFLDTALEALHQFDQRTSKAPASRLRLPEPGADAAFTNRLADPRRADPLVLYMAAMVAHERQNFTPLDLDRVDLARAVADREYRRLERLAQAEDRNPLLLHVAAYITLTGRLTSAELKGACEAEKLKVEGDSTWTARELADTLATKALPAADRLFAVDPITPDIVGEAFLLQVFQPRGDEARDAVVRAASGKAGPVTRTLVRLIQDFGPQHDKPNAADEESQRWALEVLTHLLRVKTEAIRDEDFWEIHTALPASTVTMLEPIRDFYKAVLAQGSQTNSVSLVTLEALEWYSIYESKLGGRERGLLGIKKAVSIRREYAATNPDAFLADLAATLANQANRQSEMEQRFDALQSIVEAVQIRRKLAEANPGFFLPQLASSLNNLANRQGAMGEYLAALSSITEAATHYRELAKTNPDFLPQLAGTLNNLANRQGAMGQRRRALLAIVEAVQIRRRLAEANPDAFLPDLAASLDNQGNRQGEMGQLSDALLSISEAVRIRRKLVEANPIAFLPNLATSLNNQAIRQSEIGKRSEALASIAEAVQHFRTLVERNPSAFLPNLATSLDTQAVRQSEIGQPSDALLSIAEAVEIRRKLVDVNPKAFLPDLAMSLNNQANLQSEIGKPSDALAFIAEAVQIRLKLVDANPDAFLPNLATSYGTWGRILVASKNNAEAAQKFAEGIRLITPLAKQLPQAHFRLALGLAHDYVAVCPTPDPELTWPIEVARQAENETDAGPDPEP